MRSKLFPDEPSLCAARCMSRFFLIFFYKSQNQKEAGLPRCRCRQRAAGLIPLGSQLKSPVKSTCSLRHLSLLRLHMQLNLQHQSFKDISSNVLLNSIPPSHFAPYNICFCFCLTAHLKLASLLPKAKMKEIPCGTQEKVPCVSQLSTRLFECLPWRGFPLHHWGCGSGVGRYALCMLEQELWLFACLSQPSSFGVGRA